jgi:transposase InsO family protein
VLPIAPSTYHERVAQRRAPARLSARDRQDLALKPEIARVFAENFAVYDVRKVWRQMMREGFPIARRTVERLMREMGLAGVIRGKPVRTTISDKAAPCPLDHVNRKFYAPASNMLWVSTSPTSQLGPASFMSPSLSTPMRGGSSVGEPAGRHMPASSWMPWNRRFTIVSRFIGEASSTTATAAANMSRSNIPSALRRPVSSGRSAASETATTNALAETINGLYKAEVIHRRGPWRSFEAVEFATLEWIDWFNHRRLLEPIGNIPPAEAEDRYYAMLDERPMAA